MTRYSILRYTPNDLAEEFINVGAIVYSSYGCRLFDYTGSTRVRTFSSSKLDYLRTEIDELRYILAMRGQPTLFDEITFEEDLLERMQSRFCGILRLSDPLPSTMSPDEIKPLIERTFLAEESLNRPHARSVVEIVKSGYLSVEKTISEQWSRFGAKVRKNVPLLGKNEIHEFDFSVEIEGVYLSTKAINYDIKSSRDLNLQISATFYMIMDLWKGSRNVNRFALLVPNKTARHTHLLERIGQFSKNCNVALVTSESISEWTDQEIAALVGDKIVSDIDQIGNRQRSLDLV